MKVYVFCHCWFTHEGRPEPVSVHSTKLGAYKAMRKKQWEVWEREVGYGTKYETLSVLWECTSFIIKEFEVEP